MDLISACISSLPMHAYERSLNTHGRAIHQIAYDHDLYELIAEQPNEEMSRQTFLKAFLCHCLAWGNGYAELQRDSGNNIVGIWPRNPGKTRPKRITTAVRLEPEPWRPFAVNLPAGTLVYVTTDGLEQQDDTDVSARHRHQRFIPIEDMLHVPGLALDGRLGQSTVWLARQTLGLALATEKFGAKYFANYARPGGILKMPMNLSPADKENARRSWREAQGGENSNMVAVLPPGFEWQAMSNNPEEAQSIDVRKFGRDEICAIMHVPPHMVGDVSKGGRSNTEQLAIEFIQYCLAPWTSAIKQEWKRKLFPHRGVGRKPKNPFYVDFDLTDMLRPDAASREKFNASGRQWGYLNANDVRALEKLNPIDEEWAEQYWMPVNMTLVETPIDPTHQDGAGKGEPPPDGNAPPEPAPKGKGKGKAGSRPANFEPVAVAYYRLFEDGFRRITAREDRDLKLFQSCLGPVLYTIRDTFKDEAEREMDCEIGQTLETDRFIVDYLRRMQIRSADWTARTNGAVTQEELARAVRAIRIAVYREAAAVKAAEVAAMVDDPEAHATPDDDPVPVG